MPDIPASILAAAESAIRDELQSSREIEPDRLARAALEAAAPLLAEAWGVVRPRERIEWPGAWPRTAPNPDDPTGLTVIPLPDPETPDA